MRAVRLQQLQSEPELVEIPTPEPGPGEVLIKVEAAGLCHSDLHLMEWPPEVVPYQLPFTLGHETAGTVEALGRGTTGARVGERVVVYSRWGCGRCWPCLQGLENACQDPISAGAGHGAGVGYDGGLAEYMVVRSPRYLVAIDDLDPALAAPLSDAALTPYHVLKRSAAHLRPDVTVLVIGVGGLGHIAIQLLCALSAVRIVAVDVRAEALELALAAGADTALPAGDFTPERLRAQIGGPGAGLVMDFVASDATLALAAGAVAVGGEIAYIGRGGGVLPVAPGRLHFECSVSLPSWGTLPELVEVVALARSGAIRTEVQPVALEDAINAYRRLRRGEIRGRAVVMPHQSLNEMSSIRVEAHTTPVLT